LENALYILRIWRLAWSTYWFGVELSLSDTASKWIFRSIETNVASLEGSCAREKCRWSEIRAADQPPV
jgi:hypothetical protein